jgi:hypothetical protein
LNKISSIVDINTAIAQPHSAFHKKTYIQTPVPKTNSYYAVATDYSPYSVDIFSFTLSNWHLESLNGDTLFMTNSTIPECYVFTPSTDANDNFFY